MSKPVKLIIKLDPTCSTYHPVLTVSRCRTFISCILEGGARVFYHPVKTMLHDEKISLKLVNCSQN